MMKKIAIRNSILILVFGCLFMASIAYSASIVNSKHDLSWVYEQGYHSTKFNQYNEVCVYCHTPHSANSTINVPLWNREYQGGIPDYKLYTSTTMDTTPGQPSGVSLACLSCHDGTIAVDEIINPPNTGWSDVGGAMKMSIRYNDAVGSCSSCHNPFGVPYPEAGDHTAAYLGGMGTTPDLSDDHPIGIDYNALSAQFGTEFNVPPDTQKGWGDNDVKLFSGMVECASCHNVHDPAITPFLRKSNANSELCSTCHIK